MDVDNEPLMKMVGGDAVETLVGLQTLRYLSYFRPIEPLFVLIRAFWSILDCMCLLK